MHLQPALPVLLYLVISAYAHGDDIDTTASVSVGDFKSSFISEAIVPEILAAFNPSVKFYIGYTGSDGDGALLTPGKTLTATEAKLSLEMLVENITNATNVTSSTRFIVYMVCALNSLSNRADVPSRANATSRNVRHFLAGTLTLSDTISFARSASNPNCPTQSSHASISLLLLPSTCSTAEAPIDALEWHRMTTSAEPEVSAGTPDGFSYHNVQNTGLPSENAVTSCTRGDRCNYVDFDMNVQDAVKENLADNPMFVGFGYKPTHANGILLANSLEDDIDIDYLFTEYTSSQGEDESTYQCESCQLRNGIQC